MLIVRPVAVTDDVLIYSNVRENLSDVPAIAAWDIAATYSIGDVRFVAVGTTKKDIYESLQSGNVGNAPADSPTFWSYTSSVYAEYDAGATYAVDDIVSKTGVNVHELWQSLSNSNTGNEPAAGSEHWVKLGATNQRAMFDGAVGYQTTRKDAVICVLAPGELVNTISLLNMNASGFSLKITDPVDGVVWNQTYSLVSDSGISDPYSYCFENIEYVKDLTITGLPAYPDAQFELVFSFPSQMVSVGEVLIGKSRDIGSTAAGASVGIQDYSVKETNAFGVTTVVERPFSKRAKFSILVPAGFVDTLQNILAQYRATPVVFVGSTEYGSTTVYGYYRDFDVSIEYWNYSICEIEVESLI